MTMFELGHAAHDAGKMRVPTFDPLIRQELEGMPVGTGAAEMMQQWLNGWDTANLAYRERMANMRYEPYTEGYRP